MYAQGLGVKKEDEEALKWFKLAAGQGDEDAVFAIQEILMEGPLRWPWLCHYLPKAMQDAILEMLCITRHFLPKDLQQYLGQHVIAKGLSENNNNGTLFIFILE